MVRIFRVVLALMLFSLGLAYPAVVQAQVTHTFVAANEGSWSSPENWSPENVPGYPDILDEVYKWDIPQIPIGKANLAGTFTVSGLKIWQDSALIIADSSLLEVINNPQIQNDGDIYLLGKNSTFRVPQGATFSSSPFSDGGTLTMNGGFLLTSNADPPYTIVNDDYHTIKGNGSISSLVNKGLVVAREGELWLQNVSNQGLVGQLIAEGENSSLNFCGSTLGAPPTVTGGSINLLSGGTANFYSTVLKNIVLEASGSPGEVFNCHWGTMENVTLAGGVVNLEGNSFLKGTNINKTTMNVNNITTFTKNDAGNQPTLENNGTVYVGSPDSACFSLGEDTEATFTGTGKVVLLPQLEGAALPNSLSGPSTSKYINEEDHTIQGSGVIFAPITNRGQIIADGELKFQAVNLILNEGDGTLTTAGKDTDTLLVQQSGLAGGTINPKKGTIDFLQSTLSGVSFSAGLVRMADVNSFGGFNNAADIHVVDNSGLFMYKDWSGHDPNVVNNGTIKLESLGHTTRFLAASGATVTLEGNGKVILAGNDSRLSQSGGGQFINQKNHIIEGVGLIEAPLTNYGELKAKNGTLKLTGDFPENAGTIILHGGTFDTNNQTLTNSGIIAGTGNLRTGGLTNKKEIHLLGDSGGGSVTVDGDVVNSQQGKIYLGTPSYTNFTATFTGKVINENSGYIKVSNTNVFWAGDFQNDGSYESDPSINTFQNLTVGPTGFLKGSPDDIFSVKGNFINQSTQKILWDTSTSLLSFEGGGVHLFETHSLDLGPGPRGYTENFSWGTIDIKQDNELSLQGNSALYARVILGLEIEGDLITNLFGNGHNLYYDLSQPDNNYLLGKNYALENGGFLMASSVPLPPSAWLMGSGLLGLGLLGWRRRKRGR